MSILHFNEIGWFISHENCIRTIYCNVRECEDSNKVKNYQLRKELFEINSAYRKSRSKGKKPSCDDSKISEQQKTVDFIKESYENFKQELTACNLFKATNNLPITNTEALEVAKNVYDLSRYNLTNFIGGNEEQSRIAKIEKNNYLLPSNCEFHCKDVVHIPTIYKKREFDLILMDPPWWNKYIRRKRKKTNDAYNMMFNTDLMKIPIENLLKTNGLVAVWCTNSSQNIEELKTKLFPKWGLNFLTEWYWLKVTQSGETVCTFSTPPGKQPFERIIFGSKKNFKNFPKEKLIVSIPSALHSHKPPLNDVLVNFFPEAPECLEIFARYLLPNWSSIGLEVLKLQHESCYELA